jgi:hypothetical protein
MKITDSLERANQTAALVARIRSAAQPSSGLSSKAQLVDFSSFIFFCARGIHASK